MRREVASHHVKIVVELEVKNAKLLKRQQFLENRIGELRTNNINAVQFAKSVAGFYLK